nr:AEC family transporter [Bradyrhizobium sp. dw_78]
MGVRSLALRGTVQNPIVMAIVIGAVLAATGFPLPAPVDRFLGFLGASAGPTALFALGGALALQKIDRKTAIAAGAIAVTKLVIYPVLVWGVLTYIFRTGTFWLEEGILIAALPPAGNIYVLAQRYGADHDVVSAGIVLSTLVSVATVPLAAWLVLG